MVPPNNLGPDLNGKAVNETQYRGIPPIAVKKFFQDLKLGCNMDMKITSGACQFLEGKLVDHILKGDIELHFSPTQYQLVDILTKPLDEPTFKRLIVELDQAEFTFDEISFTTNNEVEVSDGSNHSIFRRKNRWDDQIPNKDAIILYYLANGVEVDFASEPVYLASFIFHSESASRCDVLADFTTKVDPGKSAPYDSIPQQHDKTKSAGDELKTAHTNLNEPIIITDKSEEEEAKRYEDTHATSHDEPEDTSEQKKAEAEVAFLKAQPLYPNVNQLTELLLKKHVQDMEIKLPGDLKDVPNKLETYTSIVSSLTSQVAELKTLQWELTTEFLEHKSSYKKADKANLKQQPTTTTPPTTSSFQSSFFPNPPKSTPQTKGELIKKDKGKEVIFSKDAKEEETKSDSEDDHANPADSMVETSKKNKLKKFSFVTEGGEHIHFTTKKIEEEKRIEESLKAELAKQEVKSDLHLAEWREVVQACPNKKEQDPLNELNDLANKKRKRAGDFKDHSKSTKKHKSLVQHEDEVH
ncbi:hypothetical protein Tco_0362911 [Tanacetum coccineum]